MLDAIKTGLKTGLRSIRIALIVYAIQLMMAMVLGLQVYKILEASIGGSLEVNKLLHGFDYTVFRDFLNVHGASITPILGQLRWVLIVYGIVSVFVNAGVLCTVVKKEPSWQSFWLGGATFFLPFLKMALFFLAILGVWTLLLWVPVLAFLPVSIEVLPSEKNLLLIVFGVVVLYAIGLMFLFNWSVISRMDHIKEPGKVWPSIKRGGVFTLRKFGAAAGIFLSISILKWLAVGIYLLLEGASGMVTATLVFVFFAVQQLLVLAKIILRIAKYGGLNSYYTSRS